MNGNRKKQLSPVQSVLFAFGGLALLVCLAFVSSAMDGRRHIDKTPEMYGIEEDTLEYTPETALTLSIWQPKDDGGDPTSIYSYELVPVPLYTGAIWTGGYTDKDGLDGIYLTFQYDGDMNGVYERPYEYKYINTKTVSPSDLGPIVNEIANRGGNGGGYGFDGPSGRNFDDGLFFGDQVITVDILMQIFSYAHNEEGSGGGIYDKSDYEGFLTKQRITDVYDDVPEEAKKLYRYVYTTHVSVNAMHPSKADVVVASCEIELRQLTGWIDENAYYSERILEWGYVPWYQMSEESIGGWNQSFEIEVLSYEQSDSFAFQ